MSESPQDPYGGQPYYGQQPPPGYQPGYQQPGYQQPGSPPTGYYPQPGYPYGPPAYGYPQIYQPAGAQRPGTATTASVLAFVNGGLLIAAALLLFAGASVISDLGSATQTDTTFTTTEFRLDALINLLAAGLLIAGGVALAGRKSTGRTMIAVGSVIVVAAAIYWMTRFDAFSTTVFYGLLFAALSVLSIAMAFTGSTKAWLHGKAPAAPMPPMPYG